MLEHAPLEAVYIYFDTATYDEIERDVKVCNFVEDKKIGLSGDIGGPIGSHRGHNGSTYWVLDPKWRRDHLLHFKVGEYLS